MEFISEIKLYNFPIQGEISEQWSWSEYIIFVNKLQFT